jgi:protocatechuate 3,4-dioxygenase beta subunit
MAALTWAAWQQLRARGPVAHGPAAEPESTGALLDLHVVSAHQPVEGAQVTVTSGKRFRSALRTDSDGAVQIKDCPRAAVKLVVEAGGFERATRTLDMVGQDSFEARMELVPGARLSGRVHDESGKPVAGVVITVRLLGMADPNQESPWFATTLFDGQFSIDTLPQASITLEASAGDLYEPAVIAEVELPNDAPVDVLLRRMGAMTGMVISKDRTAVVNARVTLAGSGVWPARSLLTDANGEFRFDRVPDGVYEVRAEHDNDVSAPLEGVPVNPGKEAHVELMLSAGLTLRGVVRDIATGHALPNVQIEVSEESLSASLKRTRSGGDGRYVMGGLRALAHRVSARASGYVATQKWATPGDATFDLDLLRAIVVTGSIQDTDGRPIALADIEVSGRSVTGFAVRMVGPVQELADPSPGESGAPTGNLGVMQGSVPRIPLVSMPAAVSVLGGSLPAADGGSFRSDEQGHFRLEGLPPGELVLAAHKQGFVTGRSRALQVRPGEAQADVVIVLPRGELLRGRVVDGHGTPVARVRVELSALGEPVRTTVSAANGSFRFDAVRGECTLVARQSGAPLAKLVVPADEIGRRDVDLILDNAAERLGGRVLDSHAQPIESATVHVETERAREFVATAVTTADGGFEFGPLPAPPYRVWAEHPDYAPSAALAVSSAAKPLAIRLEGGTDLNVLVIAQNGSDPIAGARLNVRAGDAARAARSSRQGTFEFRHLPVGGYTLSADADGFILARLTGELQESTSGARSNVRVLLVRAGRASGEVVDRLGATVWNAEVAAGTPPDWEHAVRTNHAGHFQLGQLMPGYQTLIARYHGQTIVADQPLRIYEGEESPGAVLRLPGIADDAPAPAPAEAEPTARPAQEAPAPAHEDRPPGDSTPSPATPTPEPGAAEPAATSVVPLALVSQGNQVVIGKVIAGSAASSAGLQFGDILMSIAGEPVRSPAQARGMLSQTTGTYVGLVIRRGGVTIRVRYAN